MTSFEKRFINQVNEDVTAGAGGAFGDASSMSHGGDVPGGTDFYAPGDHRIPKALGAKSVSKKKKSKKKKSCKSNQTRNRSTGRCKSKKKTKLVKASNMTQVPFVQRDFPEQLGMAPNKSSFGGLGRNPVLGPL